MTLRRDHSAWRRRRDRPRSTSGLAAERGRPGQKEEMLSAHDRRNQAVGMMRRKWHFPAGSG
jgi:hypothetical protein